MGYSVVSRFSWDFSPAWSFLYYVTSWAPHYPAHPLLWMPRSRTFQYRTGKMQRLKVGGEREHLAGKEKYLCVGSHSQHAILSRGNKTQLSLVFCPLRSKMLNKNSTTGFTG